MNATELADELMKCSIPRLFYLDELMNNAAIMLRQQQAEIKALKQIIDANNLNQNIGQFVKPTNEPVAWTDGKGNYFDKNSFFPVDDLIPLYTHPVKELTDAEILEIANQCLVGATAWHNPDLDPIEFARAILRKASE